MSATAAASQHTPRPKRGAQAWIRAYALRSPEWALLSPLAAHVYLCLASYADHARRAWVSHRRLATMCGAWRTSIHAAIRELEEGGWIVRQVRLSRAGERLADSYELLLPGSAGLCHAEVVARVGGGQAEITSPLYRTGDIFVWRDEILVRELRLERAIIASREFCKLRAGSGCAWRLWLLLSCHTGRGRPPHVASRRELAACIGAHPRTITAGVHRLESGGWIRVTARQRYGQRLASAYGIQTRERWTPAAAAGGFSELVPAGDIPFGGDASTTAEIVPLAGRPPAEAVRRLEAVWGNSVEGLTDTDVWMLLHHYDLVDGGADAEVEAADTEAAGVEEPREAAGRMVRAFHAGLRRGARAVPQASELDTLIPLIQQHGAPRVWRAIEVAVNKLRISKAPAPGHLHLGRQHILEELARAGPAPPGRSPPGT